MLVALIVIACGTCGSREKGSRDIWERTMKRRHTFVVVVVVGKNKISIVSFFSSVIMVLFVFLFLSSFVFPSFFYVVRSTELEGDPQRVAQALQEFDILLTTGISSSSSNNNHNSRYVLV